MPQRIVLNSVGQIIESDQEHGRREFRARLVRAGRVVQADGEPGPFVIPAAAVRAAVHEGLFDGLAVFVDHPQGFETASVKGLVGVTHSAVFNETTQSADAMVRFYVDGEGGGQAAGAPNAGLAEVVVGMLDMMLADREAGIEPPNVGLSLVFWPEWEAGADDGGLNVLAAFKRVDSADIVFSPAADGRILEALSAVGSNSRAEAQGRGGGKGQNVFVDGGGVGSNSRAEAQGRGGGKGQNVFVDGGGVGNNSRAEALRRRGGKGQHVFVNGGGVGSNSRAEAQGRRGGKGWNVLVNSDGMSDLPNRVSGLVESSVFIGEERGDLPARWQVEGRRPGWLRSMRKGDENLMEDENGLNGNGEEQPGSDGVQEWIDAARRSAVPAILLRSGLPPASQERLRGRVYESPQDLEAEIDAELAYLGRLSEDRVIDLPGVHPRGAGNGSRMRVSQMTTGLDHARNAVDYLFGVPDAAVPEPMLRRSDMLYIALTGDYEWHGVFRPDRVMLTGADTTTLANLATNAMNKVVKAQLSLLTFYRWYEKIAVPTANDGSLHDMSWISFGGITTLPSVPEKGSYSELDVDDVKESDSFTKYGGYVGITREMLRKSQIQRIQAVPRALAAASVKTRSAKIAAIFTQNSGVGPTLDQDSTALFHANHSNVATTALGTDMTAWRAAALECFKHTEVSSSDRIGTFPKYCLVPPDLYHQALANFGYGDGQPATYLPEAEDRGLGDPRPVPLAVPHFTDANDWAYITDPRVWPVIHMSFSADPSGRTFPAPEIFAVTGETAGLMFTNDTLPVKVRDEFAYGVNGFRGVGKRNVS